jgi:GTP-binding protein LepA
VEAQTVANFFLAFENNLSIIPVLNKIDLPHANVESTLQQVKQSFDMNPDECLLV